MLGRRVLLVVASLALLTPVVLPTAAAGVRVAEECVSAAQDEVTAAALARRCGRDVEVTGARSEWNTLYAQADGTLRLDVSTAAIRARRGEAWVGLDNAVVRRDGSFAVASAVNPMTFSDGTPGEPLATIERGGNRLSLDVPFDLPAPRVDGDRLTYPQVLAGVDLIVTVNSDATGFSEVLRVESPEAAADPRLAELTFPIVTSDGLVVEGADGGFVARDAAGQDVFTSPTPAMWDSAESVIAAPLTGGRAAVSAFGEALALATEDVAGTGDVDRAEAPSGTEQIELLPASVTGDAVTFRPEESMLADPRTVWPVYIDPPVSGSLNDWIAIRDAFGPAYRFSPDQGVGMCDVAASATCSSTFRSRLKYRFAGLQAVGDAEAVDIVSATFSVLGTHSYDCTPRPVNVYRTDDFTSSSTWPGGGWQFQSQQVVAHRSGCSASPVRRIEFPVVEAAQALASANGSVLVLGMVAGDETSMAGWKRYGSDATLSITFNRPPNAPTGVSLTYPAGTACVTGANRPYVRVTDPTISGVLTDPNNQSVQANVTVQDISIPTWKTTLYAGEALRAGESLRSPDGRTALVLQTDGNLVIYGPNMSVVWNRGTQGLGGTTLAMQTDGNLVLYTATGGVVWHIGANGRGGTRLQMQDDGNLVLYTATNGVVWASDSPTVPPLWQGRTQPQASGATHSLSVGGLADGRTYRLVMSGIDADGGWGSAVACEVTVDLTAPSAPTITPTGPGPIYTPAAPAGGPGQDGSFTFGPGGSSDVVGYAYGFQPSVLDKWAGGTSPTVTYPIKDPGTYALYVQAVDRAGWPSPRQEHRFSVAFARRTIWSLDEAAGSQAASSDGNVHPLGLSGSVGRVYGPLGEGKPSDLALAFDGSDDTAATSGRVIDTTKSFSVAALVNPSVASGPVVVASQGGAQTSGFELGSAPCANGVGQCWSFSMATSDSATGARVTAVSGVPVQVDRWAVVAGAHDAANRSIRVLTCTLGEDPPPMTTSPDVPFSSAWAATGPLRVGAGTTGGWRGAVSQVDAFDASLGDLASEVFRMCNPTF